MQETQGARLKEQRDRFIAFAFAGAEVLIEIDDRAIVLYAAGTTDILFGTSAEGLVGHSLHELVEVGEQALVEELLGRITHAGRLDRVSVTFHPSAHGPFRALVSGIAFPERPGHVYLTVSRAHGAARGDEPVAVARSSADFAKLAQRRMDEAGQFGEEVQMTLIDLAGARLEDSLDPDAAGKFVHSVESFLRAWSVGGNSVGVLENNRFGIIHDKGLESGQVESRIADIAALFDPSGGIEVKAATLSLDHGALTQDDLSKALVYTINQFVQEGGESFAVRSLTESYGAALDETLVKVNAFRQSITSDNFVLVYQPIVNLRAWQVHHYEALARLVQGDRLFLPARFIGFAEDFGVVNELDLTVVRKAINALRASKVVRRSAEVAVNLSGRSLGTDGFVQQLLLLLVENRDVLPRLMFEVTESAELRDLDRANQVLQKLRSFGCKISIDDFGAGAAAFQYLKALHVDYVKIDGSYILDAFRSRHGRPFLKAIAALCQDLGIQTIGEMVEDARTMWLLRDVGVQFGQGYFFGRPQPDVSEFTLKARPEPATV
ncbi:EAL domain-containing protein [Novispirillum sp. DQ9]|uniref:EAL domain-containing protein n=1 Tax=Novispirillum sp. DQ9 TaxID=3398612 RepID=UPI003C7C64B7